MICAYYVVFFCKQKTAYEMRISDWSSDVCSSDLQRRTGIACPTVARLETVAKVRPLFGLHDARHLDHAGRSGPVGEEGGGVGVGGRHARNRDRKRVV